jgi:RNA-directed DNA polymerase
MRQLTGVKQGMKESDRKEPATHPVPESCGGIREGAHEALTGGSTGEVSSHEMVQTRLPTLLSEAEGNTPDRDKASDPGNRRGRRPSARVDVSRAGTGRSRSSPDEDGNPERAAKVQSHDAAMHGCGKSEKAIVPEKPPNEGPLLTAGPEEAVEGRAFAKRNPDQRNTPRTLSRTSCVSHELERVRQRAKREKGAVFSALFHHLTVDRLRESFGRLKPGAAAGVDGLCKQEYGRDLEANLHDLHGRLHRGAYRAKPSRRVYIPKADGRERPLGIAALADKIVQGAVARLLEAVYENDFMSFSYGFRPGKSPHHALDALAVGLKSKRVNWVLDADIRGFFDAIDHGWLMKFLQHRIGDRRVLCLIGKWLDAGVMEDGSWQATERGTPQGANISPLLANVYLHYVFDLWVQQWRKRHARGEMIVVRYADDFVTGFEFEDDAVRFLAGLKERLAKFALELHGEKTRLIEFGRYAAERRGKRGEGKPETFAFLGFTHICGRTKHGSFRVFRRTMAKRQIAKLIGLGEEMKVRRHEPIKVQGAWLGAVLRGYDGYHAVPGNLRSVKNFHWEVLRRWYRSLCRRSHKKRLDWNKMSLHASRWLPPPRNHHPHPEQRFFDAKHSR